jgi:hypothetical protein
MGKHISSVYSSPNWTPTVQHPYPMNFIQAPSSTHQILVHYEGKPHLQGLSVNTGPIMFPVDTQSCSYRGADYIPRYPKSKSVIAYPTSHSIPGPLLRSYIHLPNHMYMY